MTYGLNGGLYVEDGPAIHAARSAAARRTSASFRAWRELDESGRIALVEGALASPANENLRDGYPLAL